VIGGLLQSGLFFKLACSSSRPVLQAGLSFKPACSFNLSAFQPDLFSNLISSYELGVSLPIGAGGNANLNRSSLPPPRIAAKQD
jgi:hypothetical protein